MMEFFLGGNTPQGFYSFFDEFTKSADSLYILKGGPGCGKSTLMKKVGERAEKYGAEVVYIPCASDPKSLDGVWIKNMNMLFIDGTAPHVIEPSCPGARDNMIDLGRTWDEEILRRRRDEILALQYAISMKYRGAWEYMAAAQSIKSAMLGEVRNSADIYKLTRRGHRIITSNIKPCQNSRKGRRIDVFTSALTCEGVINLNSFEAYSVTELYDPYGIGGIISEEVINAALKAGYEVYAAHDPMEPDSVLQVIVPRLRYVLMRTGTMFARSEGCRRIRLDGMVSQVRIQNINRDERRIYLRLLRSAQEKLYEAKSLHDELELIYRTAIDYSETDGICRTVLDKLDEKLTVK